MEEFLPISIQLVVGALGGNVAGKLLKNMSLGTIGNTVAGILGGGIGGQLLGMLRLNAGAQPEVIEFAEIVGSIASGGVGGGVLMAIIGIIKKTLTK